MSRWLQDATGYCSSIAIKMVTLNCHQVPLVMVQAKKSIGTEAEGARLLQEAEEEQQNESFFFGKHEDSRTSWERTWEDIFNVF